MSERASQTGLPNHAASRRKLVKLLAASPLLALAYQGLPAAWQEALAHESRRGAGPGGIRCPGCGAEMPFRSSAQNRPQAVQDPVMPPQNALEDQLTGQLIETVDDAVNIWDFERVAHANNLAQHWDYLHMGVEDYETRKANREGFQRLMLRPRRLGAEPASRLDTSRASRHITRKARPARPGPLAREACCRSNRTRARSHTTRLPRRVVSRTGFRFTQRPTGT